MLVYGRRWFEAQDPEDYCERVFQVRRHADTPLHTNLCIHTSAYTPLHTHLCIHTSAYTSAYTPLHTPAALLKQ
jgi:hypothetical protein